MIEKTTYHTDFFHAYAVLLYEMVRWNREAGIDKNPPFRKKLLRTIKTKNQIKLINVDMVDCNTNGTRNVDRLKTIHQEGEIFSEEEYQAYKILQKVSKKSILGAAIRRALDKDDRRVFRKLIGELKAQMPMGKEVLRNVIGEDGIKAIEVLS